MIVKIETKDAKLPRESQSRKDKTEGRQGPLLDF